MCLYSKKESDISFTIISILLLPYIIIKFLFKNKIILLYIFILIVLGVCIGNILSI